jgi:hypothetical protein
VKQFMSVHSTAGPAFVVYAAGRASAGVALCSCGQPIAVMRRGRPNAESGTALISGAPSPRWAAWPVCRALLLVS